MTTRQARSATTIIDEAHQPGVGFSTASDAATAGRDACREALGGAQPEPEDLVLVFATVDHDPATLLQAVRAESGAAHVTGCTGYRVFTAISRGALGCAVAYLPAGDARFGIVAVENVGDDLEGSAHRATAEARKAAGPDLGHSVIMLLSDGLAGDQREFMRGAYRVGGALVPIVGGAAGDNLQLESTFLFHDDRVIPNGLVAVWITSPRPIGVGVRHGWRPIGRPLLVTRAEHNVIHELDGRPALEHYLAEQSTSSLNLDHLASELMDRPLGLATASGRYEVRHVMARGPEGSLVMFGYVPDQAVVRVMEADHDGLLAAAAGAAQDAVATLAGDPRAAVVFSCTARTAFLGSRLEEEVEIISRELGGIPAIGFFTYGEFARVSGSTGFHNATVAVLTL